MDLKNEIIVFLISAAPFVELRAAIPWGLARGLGVLEVFVISLLGNILVIIPLLFIFNCIIKMFCRMSFFDKLFSWWFFRVEKKHYLIEKYGFFGLVILVAIPLPGSGAWTGCMASTLFEIKFRKALLAVSLGVLIAGILVTSISVGSFKLWQFFKGAWMIIWL